MCGSLSFAHLCNLRTALTCPQACQFLQIKYYTMVQCRSLYKAHHLNDDVRLIHDMERLWAHLSSTAGQTPCWRMRSRRKRARAWPGAPARCRWSATATRFLGCRCCAAPAAAPGPEGRAAAWRKLGHAVHRVSATSRQGCNCGNPSGMCQSA